MALQSLALSVLITRPHAQAQRFAGQLQTAFGNTVSSVISPLLTPEFLLPDLPEGDFGALVLTSETGVHAASALLKKTPTLPDLAFCVGDHTAQVARTLGFTAHSAQGNLGELRTLLKKNSHHAPFLHLRGRDTTGSLMADLATGGIAAAEAIVYAQVPAPLTAEAVALLAAPEPLCVPVFSPRSARLLCDAIGAHPRNAPLFIVAISAAVAREIPDGLAQKLMIAAQPDAQAMIGAIGQFRFNA